MNTTDDERDELYVCDSKSLHIRMEQSKLSVSNVRSPHAVTVDYFPHVERYLGMLLAMRIRVILAHGAGALHITIDSYRKSTDVGSIADMRIREDRWSS